MSKSTNKSTNPEALKEQGNTYFTLGKFDQAIAFYSQAIDMAGDKPSHVYYGNRANAYLELNELDKSIADCVEAIKLCPTYSKAYFRQGKATIFKQDMKAGYALLEAGHQHDKTNTAIIELMQQVKVLIDEDDKMPEDHPARLMISNLFRWIESHGGKINSIRCRHYSETNRGLVASQDLKYGTAIL